MGGMQAHLRLRPAARIEEHCHDLAYRSDQETLPGRSALHTKTARKKLLSVHRTLVKISPELEARSEKGHSLKWKAIEMSNE